MRPVPSSTSKTPEPSAPKELETCPAIVTSFPENRPGSRLMFAMVVRCGHPASNRVHSPIRTADGTLVRIFSTQSSCDVSGRRFYSFLFDASADFGDGPHLPTIMTQLGGPDARSLQLSWSSNLRIEHSQQEESPCQKPHSSTLSVSSPTPTIKS